MFAELYRYLIVNRSLSLPGIGNLQLNRQPARYNFTDKKMLPPCFSVSLEKDGGSNEQTVYAWLAGEQGISKEVAEQRFDSFIQDLKEKLKAGGEFDWHGVGTFSQDATSLVSFIPAPLQTGQLPVDAEKVIRENAEHVVKVGEEIRTSTHMQAQRIVTNKRKKYNWLPAILLLFISIAYICWHTFQYGLSLHAFANEEQVDPLIITNTYTIIP